MSPVGRSATRFTQGLRAATSSKQRCRLHHVMPRPVALPNPSCEESKIALPPVYRWLYGTAVENKQS